MGPLMPLVWSALVNHGSHIPSFYLCLLGETCRALALLLHWILPCCGQPACWLVCCLHLPSSLKYCPLHCLLCHPWSHWLRWPNCPLHRPHRRWHCSGCAQEVCPLLQWYHCHCHQYGRQSNCHGRGWLPLGLLLQCWAVQAQRFGPPCSWCVPELGCYPWQSGQIGL